jgi:hypothetical protein
MTHREKLKILRDAIRDNSVLLDMQGHVRKTVFRLLKTLKLGDEIEVNSVRMMPAKPRKKAPLGGEAFQMRPKGRKS